MIKLYISIKKPDNLGKTVLKIMFKFTNARAKVFHLGMIVYWLIIYNQIVMAAFYFFSIKYNISKDFKETEIVSIYKLHAKTGFRHPTQHDKNNKKYIFSYIKLLFNLIYF